MKVVIVGLIKPDGSQIDQFFGDKNGVISFKDVDAAVFQLMAVEGYTEEEIETGLSFYFIEEEELKKFVK